ncbi:MAG: hypothetical protein BWY31_00490 [Lentisphaerae bacterium ADurb.Bin242]|nr:MAG: hypothetical protein BWY31_00490 [Lentisphaerae bacterium ADurb.Bin242]
MPRPKITLSDVYEGYRIQKSLYGSRCDILDVIVKTFRYMWTRCSQRLCVCHFTVNMPPELNLTANDSICNMLQSWRRTLENRKILAEYLWARERGDYASVPHPHYHIFLILPGRQFQYAKAIANRLDELLSRRLGRPVKLLHVNPPNRDGFCWGKKVSEKLGNLGDAIHWVSYLAKVKTKEAPPFKRSFGRSKGYLKGPLPSPSPIVVEIFKSIGVSFDEPDDDFESMDVSMSEEEQESFGYGDVNPEEYVNFDPQTGGPYEKKA